MTDREEGLVQRIERQANIQMVKVGVPQIGEIIKANTRDLKTGFDSVSKDIFPYFQPTAKEILSQHEPEEALCRALALITGYTQQFLHRSLLCSAEGYITYMVKYHRPIRAKSHMWNVLRNYFDDTLVN